MKERGEPRVTIPKMPDMSEGRDGMLHARIYPGKVAGAAGSPYNGAKRVADSDREMAMKARPYLEASKDPMAVRTTGFE